MDNQENGMINGYEIIPWQNPWARISEVAARVGVAPAQVGDPPSIMATGADGKTYDVWAVIVGVLNKLDGK